MTIPAPDIFARIYSRHGHRCPMSTLGGRLGLAGMRLLAGRAQGLSGVYLTRTCALDGIAEATGLSEEDGSLRVEPAGRHLLRLEHDAGILELELSPETLLLAGGYRRLGYELEAGWDDLSAAEREIRQATREAALDELLPKLWSLPDEELLLINEEYDG